MASRKPARRTAPASLLLAAAFLVGAAAGGVARARGVPASDATEVLLTKTQALRLAFPACESALELRHLLDAAAKERLERRLGRRLDERGFLVYLGLRGGALDGLAVVANEIGKTQPITFIVAAGLDGRVRRCAVMVYRESHGGEVRSRRFLRQLESLRLDDPIAVGRDVIHVSGATLSSHALCNGTRKVLALLEQEFLGRGTERLVADARAAAAREIALADEAPQAARGAARTEARRLVMGSELAITALSADPRAHAAVQEAMAAAEALDAVLSDWRDDSELARVNRDAAAGAVAVSPAFASFLAASGELWRATEGAFDPGIGGLVRAWGLRGGTARRPSDGELAVLRASGGMANVEFDAARATVRFRAAGVRLDPGAIGKGMAVDAAIERLRAHGIGNALVDFGSTQRAIGPGEEGDGWPVALRDPRDAARPLAVVLLRDRALSTSGGYEKQVVIDGERLPHILDPRDGRPAHGCVQASALARIAAQADALSTALFVLGPEAGERALARIDGAAGMLLLDGGRSFRSARWPGAGDEDPGACATR